MRLLFLISFCTFAACTQTVTQYPKDQELDSILAANSGIEVQIIRSGLKLDSFLSVYDTSYQFDYTVLNFAGRYFGSYSKYGCSITFADTVNKKMYVWWQPYRGAKTFTEDGHADFSAIEVMRDTNVYFLPIAINLPSPIDSIYPGSNDTVLLNFTSWLITSVNQHPVMPFLLIKNVKKY